MASKRPALALFLAVNLLFFSLVNANNPSPAPNRVACPRDALKLGAAVCLCTSINARILGINLNIPVALSLLLSACGDKLPDGFQCSS
ncbi:hypothetical protein PRUPE_5G073400 [Prunus persica]|uniref:Hydrophobic seed protein domain-containing protein n=1 Tax=Prunus persica TaxID=3760 RepID=M5WC60_PRUPE|nr:hypothetical protein PRUPE_5G073400 [Prunus persica]